MLRGHHIYSICLYFGENMKQGIIYNVDIDIFFLTRSFNLGQKSQAVCIVASQGTESLPLRWRHNGHDSVSNHQPHHCLLNGLFGCRSKKTSKIRVTGLCGNAENVSIWWRHHVLWRRLWWHWPSSWPPQVSVITEQFLICNRQYL